MEITQEAYKSERSDLDIALMFRKHIVNPCTDRDQNHEREMYIELAREYLPIMEDAVAREVIINTLNAFDRRK